MNSIPLIDGLPSWWDHTVHNHSNKYGDSLFIPTILVNDTVETDGRFLLYTMASQYLTSTSSSSSSVRFKNNISNIKSTVPQKSISRRNVFWVACGPTTERQILTSLHKIGLDVQNHSHGNFTKKNESDVIKIVPVALELANSLLHENENDIQSDFLKCVYKSFYSSMKMKRKENNDDDLNHADQIDGTLVIIDDVSYLTQLFGATYVMAFIQKIKLVLQRSDAGGILMIRSRIDLSIHNAHLLEFDWSHQTQNRHNKTHKRKNASGLNHHFPNSASTSTWMGAGGGNHIVSEHLHYSQFPHPRILDQSLLLEMANAVVDVLPLSSGFAREVHGRLVFSERFSGEIGWNNIRNGCPPSTVRSNRQSQETQGFASKVGQTNGSIKNVVQGGKLKIDSGIVNYVCGDHGVKVIRLRS